MDDRDVCLVMIVRDEAHVIERCLASVRPLITRWCIVDTGSVDATPARIEAALADLPGELHRRPWVDFGHNRSEALALAAGRGTWLLLIDADEELVIEPGFRLPSGDDPVRAWRILQRQRDGDIEFHLPRLLRADHPWRFEGVLHEWLASPEPFRKGLLPGLVQIGHFDSARNRRSQQEKYLADAALLERALAAEPGHRRYQFYLAQSLRDAGAFERAIAAYGRRAAMGGWREEVYCSHFEIARLLEAAQAPREEVVASFRAASTACPERAEPLVQLARLHREAGHHARAMRYARKAAQLERPAGALFVDASIYRWRALDELAVNSFWTGDPAGAVRIAEQMLAGDRLPEAERPRVLNNLASFRAALAD